ncbi:choice-of-anchor tandem repeat GloVer-containing protein [Methylocapsa palsarum]|uniref:Gloeo_Verruco repeat-containing protein n=1 Tax=Methylocapsa palsarum TaxID=1612308 RepID=A0A1I3Z7Q4_9HYPH|nr:choice-of-anchor tandem repeat GloVer-containing protein [Methylocapsa palsarum]SFK40118.1 Gloeo_Verruco repeat-containing protein [Methylocapsa palsarum]
MIRIDSPAGYNGTFFKLTPPAAGKTQWTEASYSFNGANGSNPMASLTSYNGALYGTTYSGGPCNCGTVFKIQWP